MSEVPPAPPRGAEPPDSGPPTITSGPGRVLVGLYGLFALAAGARATVQLATRYSAAPIAYLLSAAAAVVYLGATIALIRGTDGARRFAMVCCGVELAGVLIVGTLSLTDRGAFPDDSVWSGFGRGYGFVPLVLPILGLLWLRSVGSHRSDSGNPGDPAIRE